MTNYQFNMIMGMLNLILFAIHPNLTSLVIVMVFAICAIVSFLYEKPL